MTIAFFLFYVIPFNILNELDCYVLTATGVVMSSLAISLSLSKRHLCYTSNGRISVYSSINFLDLRFIEV